MISEFATVSSGTGEETFPGPAATFVRALSVANLDFGGFLSLGCAMNSPSFYQKVCIKSLCPGLATILLWCYPLINALRGHSSDEASKTAKRLTLLLLEITLPSVTTSLLQVLVCDSFDNGSFLRAEYTLSCSASERRVLWVAFTVLAIAVYVLGGTFTQKSLYKFPVEQ